MVTSKRRKIIAIVCGIFAALAMAFYASSVQAEAKQGRSEALLAYGGEHIEVFVATRDIAAGEALSAENVSKQLWVSDLLPNGALSEQDQVFGQSALVAIMKNEPIISAKIGTQTPITVPEALCAVSIPSEDVLAVGGAIHSGSYVSIYSADGNDVVLIAEEVLVLDTSNKTNPNANNSGIFGGSSARQSLSWVTLAVEPETVQELIAAASSEQLHLVLPGGVHD